MRQARAWAPGGRGAAKPIPQSRTPRCIGPVLVLALSMLLPALSCAAPRIGVVTMHAGETYWERFGHNAILVAPEDGSESTLYNYGYFDFDEPGFFLRFARGDMRYRLLALPMLADLAYYRAVGRGVEVQWLDLTPEQADRLIAFLRWNARPEHALYRYDYFTRNCSTQVRDALDLALDGKLKPQLSGRSHGLTWRSETLRLAAPTSWMALAIHLGLGRGGDRFLSRWEESFVPSRFADNLREARTAAGTPLVLATQMLVAPRLPPEPDAPPQWRHRFVLLGLALAALLSLTLRRLPRLASILITAFWALLGVIGLGLAALWLLSAHQAAYGNENLLLFNPLNLVLIGTAWRLRSGRRPGRYARALLRAVALIAGSAVFLKFMPFRTQDNLDWIWLVLPAQALLAMQIARREPPPPIRSRH